jgi:hypothetical protein
MTKYHFRTVKSHFCRGAKVFTADRRRVWPRATLALCVDVLWHLNLTEIGIKKFSSISIKLVCNMPLRARQFTSRAASDCIQIRATVFL